MPNTTELVAPCGMNCGLCASYLALKYDVKSQGIKMPTCTGCRPRGKQCAYLKKQCLKLNENNAFCFECKDFPCHRLRTIDARYQSRYRTSFIENLMFIKEKGLEEFVRAQEKKWRCPECGVGVICCHNGICFNCRIEKLREKKRKYRWEDVEEETEPAEKNSVRVVKDAGKT